LLTQLKVFQSIGHFLPLAQIPATALSYIAKQLSVAAVRANAVLGGPHHEYLLAPTTAQLSICG
jgi:hypothetical protein